MVGCDTERIESMRFRQVVPLAKGGGLIPKKRGELCVFAQSGIQVAFPLHCSLRDLIEVTTHSRDLEGNLPLMQSLMTGSTQRLQIGGGIFHPMLTKADVMSMQTTPTFAALMSPVSIAHQTGDA